MQRRTKKLLIVLVVIPVLVVGAAGGALVLRQHQVARSINEAYEQGRAAYEAEEYQRALPLLSRYVGRNQDDTEALLMLAESRARVPTPDGSEHVVAIRFAEAALANEPRNVRALEMLIGLYSRVSFVTELNRTCDQLLEIDPNHTGAILAKTRALIALGRYDEARRVAERLTVEGESGALALRLTLETRRLQGASAADLAAEAAEAAQRWPEDMEILVIHAQSLFGAGESEKAKELLTRIAELRPTKLRVIADYLRLADITGSMLRLGASETAWARDSAALRDRARAVIEAAMEDERLAPGAAAIGAGWEWRSQRFTQAERWLERGLEIAPASAHLLGMRAVLARDRGEPWSSYADALRSSDEMGANVWVGLIDALGHIDRREWAEASDRLQTIMTQTEQSLAAAQSFTDSSADAKQTQASEARIMAAFYSGFVDQNRGDWRLAVQRWAALSDAEPAWTLPLIAAARSLLERGQTQTAFDYALRAFRIRSGASESMLFASATVARLEAEGPSDNLFALVTPLLQELEANENLRGPALVLRARAEAVRRDQAALSAAIEALQELDTPPDAQMLAEAMRRVRVSGLDGWQTLLAITEKGGATAESTIFRAIESADAGRIDEAIMTLRRAAETNPGRAAAPYRLQEARVLAGVGRQEEARALLHAISREHDADAAIQLDILEQPAAWTESSLVETVVQRLRAASGDAGVEWRLADATRLLTFDPDPAKAQEVIVSLTRIVRDNPQHAQALSLLSEWMLLLDDERAAIEYLTRAVDVRDSPPSLQPRLIDLLRQTGRRDDARARLRQFADIQRVSPELLRTRARLLVEFRMTDLARRDFEILSRLGAPDDMLAYAALLFDQGSVSRALEIIEEVLAIPGIGRELFMAGAELLVDAGYADRALVLLDERAQAQSTGAPAADRGRLLERAGRYDEAEREYRAAAEAAEQPQPHIELARYLMRRARHGEVAGVLSAARARGVVSSDMDAVEVLASAVSQPLTDERRQAVIDTIPPGPMRDLAEATRWYDANPGRREQFVARLRPITAEAPGLVLAWQFLTSTLIEMGETEQAVAAARAAGNANPTSPVAAGLEANTLILAGRAAEARSAAERWRSLATHPLEPVLALSTIEIREGRKDAARAMLDDLARNLEPRAQEIDPALWAAFVSRYAQIGEIERARRLGSKHAAADLEWAMAMMLVAGREATPTDAARAWLRELASDVASSADGLATLADAYVALADRTGSDQDFESAIDALNQRAALTERTTGELVFEATLLERLRRRSEAESLYRRAIAQDPEQWVALNNLAYMLLRQGGAADEALALARRAYEILDRRGAPGQLRSSVLHTLAFAQLKDGDAATALQTVRQSLALGTSTAEILLTEVEAIEATGDTDRARSAAATVARQIDAGVLTARDEDRERLRAITQRLAR
ncbi:MAG: hypothetical protein EA379_12530 [Phycisphaerales bacterium]|nr:MAG: hypothetical protein EA379_12530 [Phycisphaerales bacterium]